MPENRSGVRSVTNGISLPPGRSVSEITVENGKNPFFCV